MNRIDRLNAIRILLEGRRLVTASEIAEHFALSLRTVYRDIRSLQEAGIAIEGEAGVGYRLAKQAQLRPVSFDAAEALSLLLAAKVLEHHLDSYHNDLFASAIAKIRTALPPESKDQLERLDTKIAFANIGIPPKGKVDPKALAPIQEALLKGSKLQITYKALQSQHMVQRTVVPIGILFYGGYWHMIAWCELRNDYRDFRIDRMGTIIDHGYHDLSKKLFSLDDYIKHMAAALQMGPDPTQRPIECVIRFAPASLPLLERQRFRFGFVRQRTIDAGKYRGCIEATFLYHDLDEMARWLLTFTGSAHIDSPTPLQLLYAGHCRAFQTMLT